MTIEHLESIAKIQEGIIARLMSENEKLREALSYYASGDLTKPFYGDDRYMELIADDMDLSKVGEQWKTGKRARNALT